MKNTQFWRHDNKSIELWSTAVIKKKINYIHQNPVDKKLIYKPQDFVYSSALCYADEKGLLEKIVVFRMFINPTTRSNLAAAGLEQISKGLACVKIAKNLFISVGTVRKHIENTYRKLQVHNKIEAVQKAKKHRII